MAPTQEGLDKPIIAQEESIESGHITEKISNPLYVSDIPKYNANDDVEWKGPDVQFNNIDEKKVLRKMDIRLIPMLALLYLLSFLDRGNVGNAKIEGLTEELKITGPQYNWCRMCILRVILFRYEADFVQ